MAACVSRSYVNIYHRVIRKLYLKPNRCLCTRKEDKSGSPAAENDQNVTPREADVKEGQNLSQDCIHPSDKGDEDTVQSKAHGSHKTDSIVEGTPKKSDQAAQTRLLSVLSDLKVSESSVRKRLNDNLSRPPRRIGKPKDDVEIRLRHNKRIGYDKGMGAAVKAVASTLGGDAKKTEQELVHTLTSIDIGLQVEQQINKDELDKENDKPHVDEDMVSAVRAVASSVAGEPEETESELTKKLLSLAAERNAVEENVNQTDISAIFEGMKVDKGKQEKMITKPQLKRTAVSSRHVIKHLQADVFNATPLNVFKLENREESNEAPEMLLWDDLQKKELQSLVQYAPTNPYEEIIRWTEQGKFWTFPINNEAGMEEAKVSFHQHVFLDHLLEGFPKKGPIRHFMELVITGLSKNPYCSIQRKAEHVEWFRKYFKEKEDILKQYEDAI